MIEDLEIQNMMMTTSKYECVQYKWTVTTKTTYLNDGTKKIILKTTQMMSMII